MNSHIAPTTKRATSKTAALPPRPGRWIRWRGKSLATVPTIFRSDLDSEAKQVIAVPIENGQRADLMTGLGVDFKRTRSARCAAARLPRLAEYAASSAAEAAGVAYSVGA